MRTLIDSVTLLPMDGRDPIEDAVIQIQGQRIAYAGEKDLAPVFAPERIIAGRGRIAMPGLVNAHTHVAMTLLRGVGTDLALQQWLEGAIFPREDRMVGEDIYWGTMLGIMEMLRFGCTSFLDMYSFMDEAAQAVEKSGVRAVLSRGIVGGDPEEAAFQTRLDESEALYRNWHGNCQGRVSVMVAPHAEYTTSPQSIRSMIRLAEKLGAGIHVHISETFSETQGCIERHGVTPARYFADLGLFDRHTVAAHCVSISDEDAAIFADKGVYVAHNPVSNLKLGSGVMPLYDSLLGHTALGTDGAASNNTLNMFEELRFAAILHKGAHRDPTILPAKAALEMATINGAKALGLTDVGPLSQGMKADLILVKTTGAHATPLLDPIAHIVYAAQGSDVSLTMVDGHVLYEDGQFSAFDAQEVISQARRCAQRLVD